MPKETINSLAEAIAKLEAVSHSKAESLKEHIEKDYENIKAALESVSPYLEDIKVKAEKEAAAAKTQIETKVKENPWVVLAVVGIIAFLIGLFIGREKK